MCKLATENSSDIEWDIGVSLDTLELIELNWSKPKLRFRCEYAARPHKTWRGELRLWQCQTSGTHAFAGHRFCKRHYGIAMKLSSVAELKRNLFSYTKEIAMLCCSKALASHQ